MSRSHDTAHQPIGLWIKRLDEAITAQQARAFAAQGLTRLHWQLLNSVHLARPPASRDELTSQLRAFVDPPAFTHAVNELVDRGCLQADATTLALTDEGRRLHDELSTVIANVRAKTMRGVSPEEYAATIRVLQRMVANLEGGDPER